MSQRRLLVYRHGGGWTTWLLDGHDPRCAARSPTGPACASVGGGYRLAPEHPWPTAVDDAVAVPTLSSDWSVRVGRSACSPERCCVAGDRARSWASATAWRRWSWPTRRG
ncbi:MAG: alpha/beta hydrolase fold domain-containing protein [Solirubrobacteraceae bacterium]